MQPSESLKIVGYLSGLTSGWSDDSVRFYSAEIEALDDYDACLAAVRTVMRAWKDTKKPPLGLIFDAYDAETAKRRSHRPVNFRGCNRCDSTGWVEGEPLVKQGQNGRTITYSQVVPCNCPAGDLPRQQMEAAL